MELNWLFGLYKMEHSSVSLSVHTSILPRIHVTPTIIKQCNQIQLLAVQAD